MTKAIINPQKFNRVKQEIVRRQSQMGPVEETLAIKDSLGALYGRIFSMKEKLIENELIRLTRAHAYPLP
eukprot:SAG31_NODE_43907_length_265_cov_0.620482_1_plen_69_part_01